MKTVKKKKNNELKKKAKEVRMKRQEIHFIVLLQSD